MRKIRYVLAVFFVAGLFMTIAPSLVRAETNIPGGSTVDNVNWDKSGSPYILSGDLNIVGSSLTIGPGVVVTYDRSVDYWPMVNIIGGNLIVNGKGNDRVTFDNIGGIYVGNNSVAEIKNADIKGNLNTVIFDQARGIIATSTIEGSSGIGLSISLSKVSVWGSHIKNNDIGIYVGPEVMPYMVRKDSQFGIGGIGNAIDDFPSGNLYLNISGSSIAENRSYSIENMSTTTVLAGLNWWGSASGLADPGANHTYGPVISEPWLTSEPPIDPGNDVECCSSVLFIPGLEGTRLYDASSSITSTISSRLWEPKSNSDVSRLNLNTSGDSLNTGIYSGQPIGQALGISDVYGRFMDFMDNIVGGGLIKEWRSFGYDWRKPVAEVVDGKEKKATTTESLVDVVGELAQDSKTGKVTIIAHSNGGLVAEYLVKKLSEVGKSDLIDKVISVAVPYLGTPQAILSLLHGADQSVGYGLLVKESVARQLGENMPSAYSLLPSLDYFSKIFSPTIVFASTTVHDMNDGSYTPKINTLAAQNQFITNSNNGRVNASSSDTSLAIKGNNLLLEAASTFHDVVDRFSWPLGISKWAIVGWNNMTASGVKYSEITKCWKSVIGLSCSPRPLHEKVPTTYGDGTVVSKSAANGADSVVSIDLASESKRERRNIVHSNILGASTTMAVIKSIITGSTSVSGGSSVDVNSVSSEGISRTAGWQLPEGASFGEPDNSVEPTYLIVSSHSPVMLEAFDSRGNRVGSVVRPDGTSDLYDAFEMNIVGGDYSRNDLGNGDYDTYIYLPDNGDKYSLGVEGVGTGEFTLNIDRVRGSEMIDHVEYRAVPVTPLTVASTTVTSGTNGGTFVADQTTSSQTTSSSTSSLSSSTAPLIVDSDGDGEQDMEVDPGEDVSPEISLDIFKRVIVKLASDRPDGKGIIKRIEKLEESIGRGQPANLRNIINGKAMKARHLHRGKLSASDKKELINMIGDFIGRFE